MHLAIGPAGLKVEEYENFFGVTLSQKRPKWDINNHNVILLQVAYIPDKKHPEQEQRSVEKLLCECDFNFEMIDGVPHYKIDPFACEAKKHVRNILQKEARETNKEKWELFGPKRAILDIFERVRDGEYLGQSYSGIIYVQELALLLNVPVTDMSAHCNELFSEEKIDFNGAILTEYVPRFRFPEEIRHLLAYMIEEPLGWPNGDAGDIFVHELEKAIHENTRWKHGRSAFGYGGNYPDISVHILVMFAVKWLRIILKRIENDETLQKKLFAAYAPERIARMLKEIAETFEKFSKTPL